MKIFDFFDLDLSKQNQSKFRIIKLLICSLLLIMSFTIIGYRTISLASINKENVSNKIYAEIENDSNPKSLRGFRIKKQKSKNLYFSLDNNILITIIFHSNHWYISF